MQILTSAKNPRVLAWRSLRDKKGRDAQDAFLVEGVKMVREAVSSFRPAIVTFGCWRAVREARSS